MLRRMTSLLPSVCAIAVGASSFAISYNTLRLEAVKVSAVEGGWPSYLLPLILDGGVIAGSAVLWKASQERRSRSWFAYLFVSVLVALSVVVNIAHAGPAPLAKIVAALPPLVLLGCLELVVLSNRSATRPPVDPHPAPTSVSSMPAPVAPATGGAAAAPAQPAASRQPDRGPAAGDPAGSVPVSPPAPAAPVPEEPRQQPTTREPADEPPERSPEHKPADRRAKASGSRAASARIGDMFAKHLADGGSPTDPSLSRAFAAALDVSPAYVRRVLGELRRSAALPA